MTRVAERRHQRLGLRLKRFELACCFCDHI
jgi:hypothetical protein